MLVLSHLVDLCIVLVFAQNLAATLHLGVLNAPENSADMNEKGRNRFTSSRNMGDELFCPKPTRAVVGVCSSAVELLKPARRPRGHFPLAAEWEAGHEILEILFSKVKAGDTFNSGSPIPYFCGSPPSRASNPLIHDVHFTQRRVPQPPTVLPQKSPAGSFFGGHSPLKKSSCSSSFGPNPSVRIEGFTSSTSDSHRGVSAYA